jgi:gliding motility-associated-like protein
LDPSYHYAWNFGDGFGSSSFNTSHTFNQAGTYPLALVVTNNTGCADTVQTQVTVYNSPIANFFLSYNTDVYYANMSELAITNQSLGANQYLWEFGNGDTSTLFQPAYEYTHPGIYNILLVATNQYGCRDTTVLPIDVRVPEDLYVPNAFTPDGDNNNDFFSVKSQNITDMNVIIFDRWGQEIYTSSDPSFKWDGTCKGKPVQQDVYVYLIKAKGFHGKRFDLAGSVTVLR